MGIPTRETLYRCRAHGNFRSFAPECPGGCPDSWITATHGLRPSRTVTDRLERTGEFRDETEEPVKVLEESELRAKLRTLFSHLPLGSKAPLARECGFFGRWGPQTLKGIAFRNAMLINTCQKRISGVLAKIESGALKLHTSGEIGRGGKPVYQWRQVAEEDRVPAAL